MTKCQSLYRPPQCDLGTRSYVGSCIVGSARPSRPLYSTCTCTSIQKARPTLALVRRQRSVRAQLLSLMAFCGHQRHNSAQLASVFLSACQWSLLVMRKCSKGLGQRSLNLTVFGLGANPASNCRVSRLQQPVSQLTLSTLQAANF